MGDATKKLSDDSFETDVLKAEGPVLVDFWAEWCGPCKMIGPVLEDIAKEMGGKVTIGKMNVDENAQTPTKFGVRSIPSLMIFKNGEVVANRVGAMPKQALIDWINENIGA